MRTILRTPDSGETGTPAKLETPEQTVARLTEENSALRRRIADLEPAAKRSAAMQITLPDLFKVRIKRFLSELDEALKHDPAQREELTTQISRLESVQEGLEADVVRLKVETVGSDAAAATLNTKQIRLQQVNATLGEWRDTLSNLKPVTLHGAGQIVSDIVRFYAARLQYNIAVYLEPICPEDHIARTIANICGCTKVLQQISNWAINLDNEPATFGNVAQVSAILNRALRGQPHLGSDLPEASASLVRTEKNAATINH